MIRCLSKKGAQLLRYSSTAVVNASWSEEAIRTLFIFKFT